MPKHMACNHNYKIPGAVLICFTVAPYSIFLTTPHSYNGSYNGSQ